MLLNKAECSDFFLPVNPACTTTSTTTTSTTSTTTSTTTEIPIPPIKYGALYNWYAATDVRGVSSGGGWGVPNDEDFITLISNITEGGSLKTIGYDFWDTPNSGATNNVNFNLKGAGTRQPLTGFRGIKQESGLWSSDEAAVITGYGKVRTVFFDLTIFEDNEDGKESGHAIRLFRPATPSELLQTDGTACANYIGNDLKVYRTVKIGTQVWLADNLCETKFADNSDISVVANSIAWAALTSAGMCYYDNDQTNG